MRRLLAIAIAVLIVFPTISPLFALDHMSDAGRPACCRRDGKHHCMLVDAESFAFAGARDATQAAAAIVTDRCPYGARLLPGSAHRDWSLLVSDAVFAGIVAHPAVAAQTESKRRISADRSRQKRGPPAVDLG